MEILGVKNAVNNMKISLKGFNNTLKLAEEKINKLGDISVIDHAKNREKKE